MSRSTVLVTALLVGACKPAAPEGDDALDRLVSQVLGPSDIGPEDAVVHEVGHLEPGAVVAPAASDDGGGIEPAEVSAPTTLFLVDRDAEAGWSHDVDWVWIDDDGEIRVEPQSWYPVVDGEPYVPEWHASAWGADWEPYDPAAFDEDDELPAWDAGAGASRSADADPCDPPKPKVAVTILGASFRAVRADERNYRQLLAARGYQTLGAAPGDDGRPVTPDEVLGVIRQAVALGPLEELVIVYAGHGLSTRGIWGLGDTEANLTGYVRPEELVAALAGADVERLTIVALSCYSGQLVGLPQQLKDAGMKSTDIVLHAAAGPNEPAWIPRDPRRGSAYAMALFERLAATPADEPIPWADLQVPQLTTLTSEGRRQQTPTQGEQERCVPEIGLATHPDLGACYAAWLDQLDPADFYPDQDYGRETMIGGKGFGEGTGRVELRQEDGDWVVVPHRFWSPTGVAFNLPMRRDGFPANGRSPGVPEDLRHPADRSGLPGTYLVRVVTAEGEESPPQPVKVEYQTYEQIWVPVTTPTDFPDWVEQWHPLTPSAIWTLGPTVQLSVTWNATYGVERTMIPEDLTTLDSSLDTPHLTWNTLPPGPWYYELGPGIRDVSVAYDQEFPEFQYYGYRIRFEGDEFPEEDWGFTLIYD